MDKYSHKQCNVNVDDKGSLKKQQLFPGGFMRPPGPPRTQQVSQPETPQMRPGIGRQQGRPQTRPGIGSQPERPRPQMRPGVGRQPETPQTRPGRTPWPPQQTRGGERQEPRRPQGPSQPPSPPPGFTPQMPRMNGRVQEGQAELRRGVQVPFRGRDDYRRRPGDFRGCLNRFTFIWLINGNNFWFYPTFIRRNVVEGFRWSRNNWEYERINLNRIIFHLCF